MKKLSTILNIAITLTGLELINRMLVTYNDPIIMGAIWIGLVCVKNIIEVFNK